MKTVVIDGQGGRLGQMIVEAICKEELPLDLYANQQYRYQRHAESGSIPGRDRRESGHRCL